MSGAPVVLYGSAGSEQGPDTADAASAAKVFLGSGDFGIEGPLLSLEELSPELHADGLSITPCDPAGDVEPSELLAEATRQVEEIELDAALQTLRGGASELACLGTQLDRDSLYGMFFLAGYASFLTGDSEEASRLFGRAVVLDPSRPSRPALRRARYDWKPVAWLKTLGFACSCS